MYRRTQSIRRGFTLIELLLVMAIIAILASVVIPKFAGRPEQARQTKATADITTLSGLLDIFETDNGRYPTADEGLQALVNNPGNLANWKHLTDRIPLDPWGHPYVYRIPGTNGKAFDLISYGASGQEGGADNITN